MFTAYCRKYRFWIVYMHQLLDFLKNAARCYIYICRENQNVHAHREKYLREIKIVHCMLTYSHFDKDSNVFFYYKFYKLGSFLWSTHTGKLWLFHHCGSEGELVPSLYELIILIWKWNMLRFHIWCAAVFGQLCNTGESNVLNNQRRENNFLRWRQREKYQGCLPWEKRNSTVSHRYLDCYKKEIRGTQEILMWMYLNIA